MDDTRWQRLTAYIAVAVLSIMVVAWFLSHRNQEMERLYAMAAGDPEYSHRSEDAVSAARALAGYRGQRGTRLLLNVALGKYQGNSIFGGAQLEAIRILRDRKDPVVAAELSSLLQPDVGLDTRQAVAQTLQSLPCEDECIRFILHYLERIWWGEENGEDLLVIPKGLPPSMYSHEAEQKRLYANLYSVLRRQSPGTIDSLRNIYGIGGFAPSRFALDLLSRLGLKDSCPFLLDSDKELREIYPPGTFRAPRTELQGTIASLNCRSRDQR